MFWFEVRLSGYHMADVCEDRPHNDSQQEDLNKQLRQFQCFLLVSIISQKHPAAVTASLEDLAASVAQATAAEIADVLTRDLTRAVAACEHVVLDVFLRVLEAATAP
jgi:hypothetical protein